MLQSLGFVPTLASRPVFGEQSLPANVHNSVRSDLGDQAIGSVSDSRVQQLHGFFINHERIHIEDAAAVLGGDWKEAPRTNFFVHRFVLEKDGTDTRQSISFDRKKDQTTISTHVGDRDYTLHISKPRRMPSHHGYSDGKRR